MVPSLATKPDVGRDNIKGGKEIERYNNSNEQCGGSLDNLTSLFVCNFTL